VSTTAVVLADGRLECAGETFDTPSAAAKHCSGTTAENGWTFWLAERDGELISLRDIRTQFKSAGASEAETVRHQTRYRFWTGLLDVMHERGTTRFARVSPTSDGWISAGSGHSGVHYALSIRRDEGGVHLWLERPSADENRRILEALRMHQAEIEGAFGAPLLWDVKTGRKRCWISAVLGGGYVDDEVEWPASQDRMVDAMTRLEAAVSPHLDAAVVSAREGGAPHS
jgi:hypothetical protein